MPNRKKSAGVSLLELLIAMGVIAVGMSGVAASLIFGVTKSGYGQEMAVASHLARTLIETMQGQTLISTLPSGSDNLPKDDSGINDKPSEPHRKLDAIPFNDPTINPSYNAGDFIDANHADDKVELNQLGEFSRRITLKRRSLVAGTPGEHLVDVAVTVYWEDKKDKGAEKSVTITAVLPTTKGI